MTVVDAIPTTTVARTLIDLASVCRAELVEEALDDALRRRLVTISRIRWRLRKVQGQGGRRGVASIRALLDAREHGGVPMSVFETKLLRELKAAGLPKPELQLEIRDHRSRSAHVDFAYPDERVAVEADGYRWHSGRAKWRADLVRRNTITSLGWRVIHVTWDDLHDDPASVVEAIRSALSRS